MVGRVTFGYVCKRSKCQLETFTSANHRPAARSQPRVVSCAVLSERINVLCQSHPDYQTRSNLTDEHGMALPMLMAICKQVLGPSLMSIHCDSKIVAAWLPAH